MQALWCDLTSRLAIGQKGLAAIDAVCRKAAELAPDDAWPLLLLAKSHLAAQDFVGGGSSLALAHQRLDYDRAGKGDAFRMLAELYLHASSPSLAERSSARADPATASSVAARARTLRARFGLESGVEALGLTADAEGDYLRRQLEINRLTRARQRDLAARAVADFEQRFPRLPAGPAMRCALLIDARRLDAAAKACEEALRRHDAFSTAHVWAAMIAAQRGQSRVAAVHLRRAVDLDPEQRSSWITLADHYRRSRDSGALARLEASYRERFKEPMTAQQRR
ncbi:MAG: hypothetical protein EXR72_20740 [Myxococcales bacterium]|nr:hypothetical protein [Myxococcales bacterium]